jgi:hypothetical protein
MNLNDCPELETLFLEQAEGRGPALEHAAGCEHCAAILEEHRQLEKDLFRLADPLPPPDFVHAVMAKVAKAPAPVRSEMKVGMAILAVTFGLLALSLVFGGASLGVFGVKLAAVLVQVKDLAIGAASALSALWKTAAVPLTISLSLALLMSLVVLKRLAGVSLSQEAKVS